MSELLTIAETAERLDLTVKAVEKRIERGTIQSLRNDGRRMIPLGEVVRLEAQAKHDAQRAFPLESRPLAGESPVSPMDFSGFLERLETLAAENGRFRALQEVSETTRQQLEEELHQVRAQVQELEAKLVDVEHAAGHRGEVAAAVTEAPRSRRFLFGRSNR